ncbi:hypothetical protein [Brevundimonas diminuta]|uniref:hypothetical protein n=1 Tax=Brevundimonas diminuta TaxID=293 RepID=UPI0030FA00DD
MIDGLAAMAGTVGRALLDETWLGPVGGLIGIVTATFTVLRDLWVGRQARLARLQVSRSWDGGGLLEIRFQFAARRKHANYLLLATVTDPDGIYFVTTDLSSSTVFGRGFPFEVPGAMTGAAASTYFAEEDADGAATLLLMGIDPHEVVKVRTTIYETGRRFRVFRDTINIAAPARH